MKLKCKQKTVFEVDCFDLDNFVKKVYNIEDYSFIANEECGNDSYHSFIITGKLSKWDLKMAEDIKKSKQATTYSNRLILDMLCADKYIEPGEYLIEVCW